MQKYLNTETTTEKSPGPIVDKVEIQHFYDDNPDLSYLGETSKDADPDDIKRHSVIEYPEGPGRTSYFIPQISVQEHRDGLQKIGYSKGMAEYLARLYVRRDYQRYREFMSGDICHIGIRARATVSYSIGHGNRRIEFFTSGGLWGIESDSGDDHIEEIETEELDDLKSHLKTFGIDTSNWNVSLERSRELLFQ